jgi:hypothetical protein
MATRHANSQTERAGIAQPVTVESLIQNGDLNQPLTMSLTLNQWRIVVGALSIAAAELAIERNYQQMFEYTGICSFLGQRLGMGAQQQSHVSDLSPPFSRAVAAT